MANSSPAWNVLSPGGTSAIASGAASGASTPGKQPWSVITLVGELPEGPGGGGRASTGGASTPVAASTTGTWTLPPAGAPEETHPDGESSSATTPALPPAPWPAPYVPNATRRPQGWTVPPPLAGSVPPTTLSALDRPVSPPPGLTPWPVASPIHEVVAETCASTTSVAATSAPCAAATGASTPGVAATGALGAAATGASTPGASSTPAANSTDAIVPVPTAAAAPLLVLTVDQIPLYRSGYSCKRAHTLLSKLRQRCAHAEAESIDLTCYAEWRPYLCSHPHARMIIGNGIQNFEARFVNSMEPNRGTLKLPPPYGSFRFDFIAMRSDGSACRLHPSGKRDAVPVQGILTDWLIHHVTDLQPSAPGVAAGASTPGPIGSDVRVSQRPGGSLANIYVNYSQTDVVSNGQALGMLMDMYQSHIDAGGEEATLRESLLLSASTPGGFDWPRFLMGRPYGREILAEGVTSIDLVAVSGMPALFINTERVPETRLVSFKGGGSICEHML